MKPLLFIIRKSIKNKLLDLKKKPAKLIAYIAFIGFLILAVATGGKSKTGGSIIKEDIYGTVSAVIILLFTVPDILSSLNKGGTFFRNSDVNLIFTAPISPQKVLVYGFIKQLYTVLISMIFVLFQLPNLYRFQNVKGYGGIIIIGALFLLIFLNSIIKILLYSIVSRKDYYRERVMNGFKAAGLIIVLAYFGIAFKLNSPSKAIVIILNNKYVKYVPVYGWLKELSMSAINGVNLNTLLYLILVICSGVIFSVILYKSNTDYYEDVLSATEVKERAYKIKKGEKVSSERKRKLRKINYNVRGKGASAILYRQLLEYKKTGFGIVNIQSGIYVVLGITIGHFMPEKDLRIVLGMAAYLLFIFSFSGKWQLELTKPYIFMLPAGSVKKLIYATVVDNMKNCINGVLFFVIAGFLFKSSILTIILCILTYTSLGAIFIYGGVLTKRIFGDSENIVFVAIVRLVIVLFIVSPGVAIFIIISVIAKASLLQYLAYLAVILYNLLFSFIILLFSKGIFEGIELN